MSNHRATSITKKSFYRRFNSTRMTHWVFKLIRCRKLFKFKPIDITKKVSNDNDRRLEASVRSRTLEFEFLIYNCANYWKPLSNKKKKKLKAIKIENNKTQ